MPRWTLNMFEGRLLPGLLRRCSRAAASKAIISVWMVSGPGCLMHPVDVVALLLANWQARAAALVDFQPVATPRSLSAALVMEKATRAQRFENNASNDCSRHLVMPLQRGDKVHCLICVAARRILGGLLKSTCFGNGDATAADRILARKRRAGTLRAACCPRLRTSFAARSTAQPWTGSSRLAALYDKAFYKPGESVNKELFAEELRATLAELRPKFPMPQGALADVTLAISHYMRINVNAVANEILKDQHSEKQWMPWAMNILKQGSLCSLRSAGSGKVWR